MRTPGSITLAWMPFNPGHPGLNHRPVYVRARASESFEQPYEEHKIDWSRLRAEEERLELERLIAKACQ